MLAAVLALTASVSWGIADFLGGLKSRTVPLLTVLALAQPAGLAALVLIAPFAGAPDERAVLWAAPAAVLGTIGIASFYRGMAIGSMSIVAPIAATGAAIPVVAGVAMGERPSALQVAGFALAIGGAVLASRESPSELGRATVAAGVPWAVLAAVGFGAYFVPMHEASEHDFVWAALIFRVTVATLVLATVAVVRPPLRVSGRDLRTILVIGLLDAGGNVFFAAAATAGLVSVVSVLASLYPVTTVALAWIYLRERIEAVQAAGVAAALAGVVAISAG